jgi:NAD(P)-dependent dehydrogenase (short-subunit alcohol dehydrogenase family)
MKSAARSTARFAAVDALAAAGLLGRANEPDEVARVIAYLAGEDARPITGTVFAVDAGRSATL